MKGSVREPKATVDIPARTPGTCGPVVSQASFRGGEPASRTVLTREQREELKQRIDLEKRKRIANSEARLKLDPTVSPRYRTYYWRHRDKILARRRERREAA